MSDTLQQTIKVNGETIIIYNNRKPDSYAEADIYDPDNPSSGKYFPSLNSIVIKTDGSLWYVSDRNETTYKVTLSPCSIYTASIEESTVQVVSYGNDKFCLYQDKRVSPYKLVVDAKLLFYGISLKEYVLVRKNSEGEEEIISMYLDSTDKFVSNRIPLTAVSEDMNAYNFPTNCHTTAELTEGEAITLRVYNTLGNVAAELVVFVRNATWLNDLKSITNPIVEFNATCLQEVGNDWYIYERQDSSHLNIQPYLVYADGTKTYLPIDQMKCFMYGLDDFIPSYPGFTQTIIFKYFLGKNESATTPGTYLSCTKKVKVLKKESHYSGKISTIPVYSKSIGKWTLRFFLYSDKRDKCYDITNDCVLNEDFKFDGSYNSYGTEQHVVVDYDMQNVLNTEDSMPGSQTLYITVWNPSEYERYTFRDNSDSDVIYGVDGSVTRRPIINYDTDNKTYFIPTSIFKNKEAVIESFYTKARPFYDTRMESVAPTPTHFVMRDANSGQQLNANPIALTEYGKEFSKITSDDTDYIDQTVIIEFLQEVQGTYLILYGVPVDVRTGTFNDTNHD